MAIPQKFDDNRVLRKSGQWLNRLDFKQQGDVILLQKVKQRKQIGISLFFVACALGSALAQPPATILAPVEGEVIEQGTIYTIRWIQENPETQMIVKFSSDSGMTMNPLSEKSPVGETTYIWKIDEDLYPESHQCYIYVAIYYAQHLYGQSGLFSIVPASRVKRTALFAVMPSAEEASLRVYTISGRRIAPGLIGKMRNAEAITRLVLRVPDTAAAGPVLDFEP